MAVGLFACGHFQYGGAFSHNESMSATTLEKPSALLPERETSLFRVLVAVSFCHMLNDMVQSLLPSVYPILKGSFHLNFGQIGLIALVNQVTASLLQPFVGLYTDRKAAAVLSSRRHDSDVDGPLDAGLCADLWLAAGGCGARRRGFGGLSSRVFPRRADGLWRPAWICAVLLSSGRQQRQRDRTAGCGLHCAASRPARYGVVQYLRPDRGCGALLG